MNLLKTSILLLTIITSINCKPKEAEKNKISVKIDRTVAFNLQEYETAYFASGCFWCVEAVFESVEGVTEVISGYSGGTEEYPTYEEVGYGRTTHAEAVEVYYDPKIISFKTLVQVFFGSHDPTTLNRQGPDRGTQYRSIAFYKNDEEKKIIEEYIGKLTADKVYDDPIITQVVPFRVFYNAEDYHQDYEKRHPNNPYIRNVSIPRLKKFQKKFPMLLKKEAH
ncbi:peptide-methionine (S)-S-oxide reductase [Saonia flava]|uniref:Peptide methionine sulfoxide reductase MsrA n=1 Tax=Saonia flava TaxID=523696 RepID=A0A846QTU6_9FLAO|nr:peptide-methionine (S)-S-oxide reductase MsrA [Saonia flava]NJB72386.1 peptide-methionine (S)-S-oxide reductase [Saonia flava]